MPDKSENFYITCAIPYTNGPAHLGHALEFVISDVLSRYHRSLGKKVILQHGADEHGSKNFKKAQELKKKPQDFVDDITNNFVDAHKILNVKYDRFVRTSSPVHKKSAQDFWKKLIESKDIYKGTYKGLYCVGCEAFVTEGQAREQGNICPIHQAPYDQVEEENYFFKLSKYTALIKQAIETDAFEVVPKTRKHEILSLLNDGLQDISASRPTSVLPWGVPVPEDSDQVMYVWFEALINYLTALGYPKGDMDDFWPADIQIIGKDILRFHAAIWPALLMSAGLPLPKKLYVHGFINVEGKKMSKSTGNVVNPFEIIENYGTDPFRYYLLRHVPSGEDGDFTWEKFENAYNGELANDLGNLVYRVGSMIRRYQAGATGKTTAHEHDEEPYHRALEELRFDRALDWVWEMIQGLNQYIDEQKPWQLAKTDDEHLAEVMAYLTSSLLQVSDLLEPFMPQVGGLIKQTFSTGLIPEDIKPIFPKKYLHTAEPSR